MINIKNRKAFSMLVAISVIVTMSTLTMLVMSLSAKSIQNTTAQYQREQAILLSKSYTEYAIMAVMANDRNNTHTTGNNCIDTIISTVGANGSDINGEGYRVRTFISYIGDSGINSCSRIITNAVTTPKSKLNILVDVYVDYKDLNSPDIPASQWITYHRRTLQKI